ncbi:hypothetical protein [Bacillus sp. FJAT-49736]|uniref:hypothetical protein n=1 Tax=Bacillus sp. FJAT-49736 TaxID=2833582 RepID=UPI001BC9DF96|nr:hypothetical protein [Bacillus sp. FJAT-49736]MBS4175344.1 hypothetical protein [Bacillus sp. FJAT-49736]
MNSIVPVMKMHTKEKWGWFYLSWIILLFSFSINLIIGIVTSGTEPIYTGGMASIFIYMLAAGIGTLQMFQFAIGLSVRRKDFYFGTTGMFISVSAANSIVLLILSIVEKVSDSWGVSLHFFHLPYLNEGSLIEQFIIYFILMMNMLFLGFVIASIFLRFGRNGLLVFFGAVFVIITAVSFVLTYFEKWGIFFHWIAGHSAFELSLWMIPVVLLYMIVSYLLFKRATV